MDLLAASRGDIEQMRLDPLARARLIGERGDRIEEREAEARRAEALDRAEASRAMAEAVERTQIAARGYSDRELAELRAEQEAARAERIAELEAELDRLDPGRRAARQMGRSAAAAQMEDTLRRARAVDADGSMARRVAEYERRAQVRRSQERQAEIARLEAAGYGKQEITRTTTEPGFRIGY